MLSSIIHMISWNTCACNAQIWRSFMGSCMQKN